MKRHSNNIPAVLAVLVTACVAAQADAAEPATVKLTTDDAVLEVTFEDGEKLVVTSRGTPLAPGTWFVKSLRLLRKDKRGRAWELRCNKQLSTLKSITVAAGQEKVLDTGCKPIHFDYFIWPRMRDGELRILFRFAAQGGYGEVYYPGASLGRNVPPMPAYRITDGEGKVLAEGRLKHETNDVGTFDWIVPKGLTANCKIEIRPVMGPFEWGPESKEFEPKPRN